MKRKMVFAGVMAGTLGLALASSMAQDSTAPSDDGQQSATCEPVTTDEIAALFDDWNEALQTRDPDAVVALYGPESVLVPTLSNQIRLTPAEKRDYFVHFLENGPDGSIDQREIRIGCNSALDIGLYTFSFADTGDVAHARYSYTYAFEDGAWAIASHHSSLMPEATE